VSCDERACPRCVPVHGRRTFASMYVKQSGSTLFQYHIFDYRAWFGHQTKPETSDSVSGIRLERFVAASALSRRAVTVTTSAEVVDSSTGRLSHHCMTPCELWDAQSLVRRPLRLVRRFRCALEERLAMRRESARSRRPFHDHSVGWGGRLMDQATVPPPHDISCELWDAQTPARHPHRLVRRF
jgi:hypothetical protein